MISVKDRLTDKQRVKQWLLQGKVLNRFSEECQFMAQPTNRINELKHEGMQIEDDWHETISGRRYKIYWMTKEGIKQYRENEKQRTI